MHDSALPDRALLDEAGRPIKFCSHCDEPLPNRRVFYHQECAEICRNRTEKRCTGCGEVKPLERYARQRGALDGTRTKCNTCQIKQRIAYADADPDQNLNAHLKRRFGISLEEFRAMAAAQGGVCAICFQPPAITEANRPRRQGRAVRARLVVDHDHATGQIRGLLCTPCNRGIGFLGDTPERVSAALIYLEGAAGGERRQHRNQGAGTGRHRRRVPGRRQQPSGHAHPVLQ